MNILTVTALFFLLAVGLVLAAAAACRTVWRNLGRRRGAFAALAVLAVACAVLAQKSGTISFDRLIADAGSYLTNDVVHVAATNAAAYASFDFSASPLLVYARPVGSTNSADWAELAPRRTFGEQPADWHLPNATNYNVLVAVDYVPPSPVHTNGVYELRGFVVPSAGADTRAAGFIRSDTELK